jgi:hypothetical protein
MRLAVSMTALAAVVLVAGAAFANNPDPTFSFGGTYLNVSPNNTEVGNPIFQSDYEFFLRNAQNQPVVGFLAADVELRKVLCNNQFVIHPIGPSDAQGRMLWDAAALDVPGGACLGSLTAPAVEVHVIGIGLFWTLVSMSSPDIDGINCTDLVDFATMRTAFNNGGPLYIGDQDGDGDVDLQDFTYVVRHFNAPAGDCI